MGRKKSLKRTGSTSSLASLSSMSSVQMHLPERKGADFLNEDEVRDRGSWTMTPLDMPGFQGLSQNVQPRDVIPEVVRNKRFNRHMDVLPDPRTRVVLPMVNGDEATTYVNANYVRGADGNPKYYICAMGPLPATLKNWWRMIWQEKVTCIAMVTGLVEKGVKKCERYWAPKPGQKVKVADMFVRTVAVSEGKGYLRTLLEIQHTSGQTRKVMHLWYHSWPDHGVPRTEDGKPDATNLLYLIRDAHRSEQQLSVGGPLLTHCSAGVGRSGTLIALDMACQLLEANKACDLVEIVRAIRKDRVALVQHPQQFELAHAGCSLYAEFVEATMALSDKAKSAAVIFDREAFERAIKQQSAATDEDGITGDLYEEVPEAKEARAYGQLSAPITPKSQPTAQQQQQQQQGSEDVYGQMLPAKGGAAQDNNPYGSPVNGGPMNPNDVYGAPVQPTAAASSSQPPANPFGHVKLKKVQRKEEDDDDDAGEQPANEYSVMKHVPIAQQQLLYEDAEEDNTPAPADAGDMYGAPVATTAGTAGQGMYDNDALPGQSTYGNQAVVDAEEQKRRQQMAGQQQYFNQEVLGNAAGVTADANAGQLYANDEAAAEEEKRQREKREKRAAAERKIAEMQAQLDKTVSSLETVVQQRKEAEAQLDGHAGEVKRCEAKLKNARELERDASLALQQAETALESQRELMQDLAVRMSEAQQREVEEKERLKKEAEATRASGILAAVGLSSSTTGMKFHARSLALAMQPLPKGKAVPPARRKVVTDRAAAEESKREAVGDIKLLAIVGCVSRYR